MRITIEIDENLKDEVVIKCSAISNEIKEIINTINNQNKILVKKNKVEEFISIKSIFRVDTIDDRTFIYTKDEVYETDYRIYEIEKILPEDIFIRISKAAVINIFKIKSLKSDLNRRIKLTLINGDKEIVNRTYVANFREHMNAIKRRVSNEKNL